MRSHIPYLEAVVLQQPQAPDGGFIIVAAVNLLQHGVVRVLYPDLHRQTKQQRNKHIQYKTRGIYLFSHNIAWRTRGKCGKPGLVG